MLLSREESSVDFARDRLICLPIIHKFDFDLLSDSCATVHNIFADTNKMKIIPALFAIGFICCGAGIDAFSFTSLLRSRPYDLTTSSFGDAQSMHQRRPRTKSKCIFCMKGDQLSSNDNNMSRRSALRQFGSFCLSTIASTQIHQQPAQASSFSDSPISNPVPRQEVVDSGPLPPQFAGNNVVVPSKGPLSVPSSSASNSLTTTTTTSSSSQPTISATQVKLENSQIVTIPTVQQTKFTPSASTPAPSPAAHSTTPKVSIQSLKKGAMPEVALATFLVGSIFYTFNGRTVVDDTGSPKVKVVMIQPEPYGMGVGRRYWNGVDVTINDPIPPADVREVCDAGLVTSECAESITGFLGEVSNEQRGADVSPEQVEKATAVANYLDSLSSRGINGNSPGHGGSTNTATAFYSYLNELSSGNLPAPSSAASVASYLDALDLKGSDSLDGYQRAVRLSAIETKINRLEERVEMLPSEIVSKMQDWQQGQDLRLSDEIRKIRAFLIQGDQQQQANGEDEPELVQKMIVGQPSTLPYL